MASPARPIVETRYDQMFPRLDAAEIDRLRRFGERRSYRVGDCPDLAAYEGSGVHYRASPLESNEGRTPCCVDVSHA